MEQATLGLEQALIGLKQAQNNTQIPNEQKAEIRKQISCFEQMIPLYKKGVIEMKNAENKFANNSAKLQEEYTRIMNKIDEQKPNTCN